MKILTAILLFVTFHLYGQNFVFIPDPVFASHLATVLPNAIKGDSLDVSHSMVTTGTKTINISALAVTNLSGVEHFLSLKYLYCSHNPSLTTIPKLPNSLRVLLVRYAILDALPLLPDSLEILHIYNSNLKVLPHLPATLKELFLYYNEVQTISQLPSSLEILDIGANKLSVLPSLPPQLRILSCPGNSLTQLPSLPSSLTGLDCRSNFALTSIPTLPQNLESLSYDNCPVENLGLLPSTLRYLTLDYTGTDSLNYNGQLLEVLKCSNNKIRVLPLLPQKLLFLSCSSNRLRLLPVLPDSLLHLDCSNNLLVALPFLPNTIQRLFCGFNQISCLQNIPSNIWPVSGKNTFYINLLPNPISCLPELKYSAMPASHLSFPLCSASENEACSKLTSENEVRIDEQFSLFPNPAIMHVSVRSKTPIDRISIWDCTGREVLITEFTIAKIDISGLEPGVYNVIAQRGERKTFRKFMVVR